MKSRRVPALAAGAYVAFALALGVGVTATAGAGAVPAGSSAQGSQPAATATPKSPSLATARLQGTFSVIRRITSIHNFEGKVGKIKDETWRFAPVCTSGPCTVLASDDGGTDQFTRSGVTYSTSYRTTVSCDSAHQRAKPSARGCW